MKRLFRYTGVALVIVFLGCITANVKPAWVLRDSVKKGMSVTQVRDTLGKPKTNSPPEDPRLRGRVKVLEYYLIPDDPNCPEQHVMDAMMSCATLGMTAQRGKKVYRLYFLDKRYVDSCRIVEGPAPMGFCRLLEHKIAASLGHSR
jgi:hypothetical protein